MLSDALTYALFVYVLTFAIALFTAGIIKVIQLGTSVGGNKAGNPSNKTGGK